jgi:hypothetical protein
VQSDAEHLYVQLGEQVCRSLGTGLSGEEVIVTLIEAGAPARKAVIVAGAAVEATDGDRTP